MQYNIEDEFHAEVISTHESLEEALTEARRLAEITWDEVPNRAPCTNWRNCGRRYEIIAYNSDNKPVRRILALEIDTTGAVMGEDVAAFHKPAGSPVPIERDPSP